MKNWRIQIHIGSRTELEEQLTGYVIEKVIKARKQSKFSQRQLSQLLRRSNSYISKIEAGDIDLRVTDLIGIAWLLDKPISYFYPDNLEKHHGKIVGEERELIEQFRNITNPDMRELAVKQISQLASHRLSPKPKRKTKLRLHSAG